MWCLAWRLSTGLTPSDQITARGVTVSDLTLVGPAATAMTSNGIRLEENAKVHILRANLTNWYCAALRCSCTVLLDPHYWTVLRFRCPPRR